MPTTELVAVWSDTPCPDCDAPAGQLCHWYCARYADTPGDDDD